MLRAARWYIAHMGPVLALRGKVPAGGCGVTSPIRTSGAAEQWLGSGGYNLGLRLDQYLVFDVDAKHGAHLRALGPLPVTPIQRTPSGGWHVLFAIPELLGGIRLLGHLGTGIDVKYGRGQQIVVYPTPGYTWDVSPATALVSVCPGGLLDRVTEPLQVLAPSEGADIPDDQRLRRAAAYVSALPPSIAGRGGDMALWRACMSAVRGFSLDPTTAHRILMQYFNPRCCPPWEPQRVATKVNSASRCGLPDGYLL